MTTAAYLLMLCVAANQCGSVQFFATRPACEAARAEREANGAGPIGQSGPHAGTLVCMSRSEVYGTNSTKARPTKGASKVASQHTPPPPSKEIGAEELPAALLGGAFG